METKKVCITARYGNKYVKIYKSKYELTTLFCLG